MKDQLQDFAKSLSDSANKTDEELGKSLITASCALLAFLAALSAITGHSPRQPIFLVLGWLCFLVSIGAGTLRYILLSKRYRKTGANCLQAPEKVVRVVSGHPFLMTPDASHVENLSRKTQVLAFFLGLTLTGISLFLSYSLDSTQASQVEHSSSVVTY